MALNLTPKKNAGAPAPATEPELPSADPNFDPASNPLAAKILNADVAGVSIPAEDFEDPTIAPLSDNGKALMKAGLALVPLDGGGVVLYNPNVVKPAEAKEYAASEGVEQLFPNWRTVAGDGAQAPAGEAPKLGGAMGGGGPMSPPQAPQAQRATATARNRAQAADSLPNTRKAVPAGGSILNRVMQDVV